MSDGVDPGAYDRCMACMQLRGSAPACPHCGHREGDDEPDPRHLPLRTVLEGRYLIGRVLGQGGFGITYAAWDCTLQNRRAIKEYFPDDAAHRRAEGVTVAARSRATRTLYDDGLERFLAEARTLEKFQDEPGIVQVRDFFRANGTGYLVMAFLEGRTVKALLEEHGGRFAYPVALPLLLPVMEALQKVHDSGLLHRDISPDNLMITLNRQVRLLDFGAAKSLVSERSRSLAGVFKKGYTPCEQYRDDAQLGPPTDVYALAATMYRMLTGAVPQGALDRQQADALRPPSALGVVMPQAAEQALMKALAIEPAQRFASVQAFRDALVAAPGDAPPAAAPSPRPAPAPAPTAPPGDGAPGPAPRPVPAPIPPAVDPRLMFYGIPAAVIGGLGLIAWVAGSKAPTITSVEFPAQITIGRTATLKIGVEDPDADLERLEFTSLEGSWKIAPHDLAQRLGGRTSGTVEIALTARAPEKARLEVVAIDRGRHRSAAHEIRFVSVEPPPSPPVLVRVQAPANALAGQAFTTRTSFEDADGDMRRLTVRPLTGSGNFPPVELAGVQRQGQVTYQISVASPGRYRYAYQLEDAKGLRSNEAEIEVTIVAPPARAVAPAPAPWNPTPPPSAAPAPPPHDPPRPPLPDAARLLNDLLRGSGLKR